MSHAFSVAHLKEMYNEATQLLETFVATLSKNGGHFAGIHKSRDFPLQLRLVNGELTLITYAFGHELRSVVKWTNISTVVGIPWEWREDDPLIAATEETK